MAALEAKKFGTVNGLDVDALHRVIDEVKKRPGNRHRRIQVKTGWKGQARSETAADGYTLGGQEIKRRFTNTTDEPSNYWAKTPRLTHKSC